MKVFNIVRFVKVFVPSSGDLFLIGCRDANEDFPMTWSFRPLFWGFVFNKMENHEGRREDLRFRPLFWGFVFNCPCCTHKSSIISIVFVPSSGDLFLIDEVLKMTLKEINRVFVPSSGDLFLMSGCSSIKDGSTKPVFVPSSGDLFLIGTQNLCEHLGKLQVFVPSSGDLFLMAPRRLERRHQKCRLFSSPLLGICF